MRRWFGPVCGLSMVVALSGAQPALAQPAPAAAGTIDPSTIEVPDLAFTPDRAAVRNYDKYFYFHRENTDFATAYADLRECDGYARGVGFRADGSPFTGPLMGLAIDAIFGSAERRRIRRVNMRVCMRFKEYRIYGLPKSIWEQFNFEEGNRQIAENERQRLLSVQARIASGPQPTLGEIAE